MGSWSWPRRVFPLALVLFLALVLKAHHLGHAGLHYFDESFHAVVARNLFKHPLKPTLIDEPRIPYDITNWGETHVWLHKPILPLWQIALSYALLGVNTFALRLPSALGSTAAVLLTFLIGRALFDRRTGLCAAALQAINPAITLLVQGHLFSDHVDIALLFWVEVGVYFLIRAVRSGSWRDVLLAGLAQGLAYLSKSYLAAIVTGIALFAWLAPVLGLGTREELQIRLRHIVLLVAATLVTIAPWTAYCVVHYPGEFFHEHGYVFAHLSSGIEIWGAPWDRVVFDYMIMLYHVFYTPVLVAAFALLGRAFAQRQTSLCIVYAWGLGVLAPHLVAATKTPSATLLAMPAFLLLLGHLISEALAGKRWPLATWAAIVIVSLIYPAQIRPRGHGYPDPPVFAGVMRQALWVVGHVTAALGIALALYAGGKAARRVFPAQVRALELPSVKALRLLALAGTLVLAIESVYASWNITKRSRARPSFPELAALVKTRLPKNATLLFEGRDTGEHQAMMLLSDRPCYFLRGRSIDVVARQVVRGGGIPYIVSSARPPQQPLFESRAEGRALYEWRDNALAAGAGAPLR